MLILVHAHIEKNFLKKQICWCGCNEQIKDYFLLENDSLDAKSCAIKLKNFFSDEKDTEQEKDIKYTVRKIYSIKPVIK